MTCCGVAASASTLSGQFSGSFGAPTSSTSSTFVHEGAGTNEFSWGAPSHGSSAVEEGNASSISANTNDFDFGTAQPGEFLLGSITWVNHSNWHAGGSWDNVLTLMLDIQTPNGIVQQSTPIGFSVYNSTDVSFSTDENERLGSNPDDISGFVFDGGAFDLPISLGNGLNLTEINFRLDDAGTPGAAWTDADGFTHNGGASAAQYDLLTGFWESREGGSSTIGVYGTVAAVPLPAGMLLMMSGLGGLVLLRRRTSKSA